MCGGGGYCGGVLCYGVEEVGVVGGDCGVHVR